MRVLVEGQPKRRVTKGEGSHKRKVNKMECYYCKKKEHIHMMCKEMKEDLKRMSSLKDGRKDIESSREDDLGFVEEEDYGALLLMEECLMGKNK